MGRGLARRAGPNGAIYWPALSKQGVGPRGPGEGPGFVGLSVEGNASGWLHRAANTSRSWQWKGYGPVQLRPNESSDWLALSDHHLFILFSRPIFLFSNMFEV
ncbi:hypothetical protein RHGRI_011460 [Rhododendron griersonianum]|uniref:Uncharacterized protein n=1 Tax=Rhododendron griersonianum TaxID=479676 RepID=A0AAV6KMM1_9ERIC|nr:hypothetical protein RHGRI_011460 [Rhododendron griersonianum]